MATFEQLMAKYPDKSFFPMMSFENDKLTISIFVHDVKKVHEILKCNCSYEIIDADQSSGKDPTSYFVFPTMEDYRKAKVTLRIAYPNNIAFVNF